MLYLIPVSGLILLIDKSFGSVQSELWSKISIPTNYWEPLNHTDEKAYGSRMSCAVGCQLLGTECQAFLFDKAIKKCSWGQVVPVDPYNNFIPTYLQDGMEISFKKSLLVKNSVKDVTHFGYLDDLPAGAITDAALERPDLLPVSIPLPPYESPYFAVESYRNGILCCGGMITGSTGDKKCRHWTFKSKRWSTLSESESVHLHWEAASAILNNRLWVFGGRRNLGTNVAYNQVESYDLDKGVWQLQQDAPADMNRYMFNAVPITKTSKILIVSGWGNAMTRDKAYLLNPADESYTEVGSLGALAQMDCAVNPHDDNMVICAGGHGHGGYSATVHFFDATTETFSTPNPDYSLLQPGVLRFVNSATDLYAVQLAQDDSTKVIKYLDGETPAWEVMTNTVVTYTVGMNYYYTIDYHELLVV